MTVFASSLQMSWNITAYASFLPNRAAVFCEYIQKDDVQC
jgi:hypothetical protein